jgi:GT2 family glycosyltransferase
MSESVHSLSIVIPTYNAVGKVESLLTRLSHFQAKYGEAYQIIVTDDASTDGTTGEIRRLFPGVTIVESRVNRGFGANVMVGVAAATNEYLAIVNSDIELCGNPFHDLIDALVQDPNLFAAMPLIFNRNLEQVENLARLYCYRGLCWHTELPQEDQWTSILREVLSAAKDVKARLHDIAATEPPILSVLCGAVFVCSRERFALLGGFDPRYQPFYWEDVDLDFKARMKGWRCATIPRAAVIHRHSETINRVHGERKLLFLRINQLRFVQAHMPLLPDLRSPRIWWFARSVREFFGGNAELRAAYLRAAQGKPA